MTSSGFNITRPQESLLRACTGRGPAAIAAWREWKDLVDMERLGPGTTCLFPLLHSNLRKQGFEESALPGKLKGVYRQAWSRNEVLFHAVRGALNALHAAGIEVMLIKGPALAVAGYKDAGLRPMKNFAVLVPESRLASTIQTLTTAGWVSRFLHLDRALPIRHAAEFLDADGHRLDLHWRFLLERPGINPWDHAIPHDFDGLPVRIPLPADQLLQVCVYGPLAGEPPRLRWAADAWTIIHAAVPPLDWNALVDSAQQHELVALLRDALLFLKQTLDADIPDAALARLASIPISPADRHEHVITTRLQRRFGLLPVWWHSYRRLKRAGGPEMNGLGFGRYLQYTLDVPRLWRLPFTMAGVALRRLRDDRQFHE